MPIIILPYISTLSIIALLYLHKAMSAGGEPFSYFRTSGLCVICNYVLHTLEYCTSSTRRKRISDFRTPTHLMLISVATVAATPQPRDAFLERRRGGVGRVR